MAIQWVKCAGYCRSTGQPIINGRTMETAGTMPSTSLSSGRQSKSTPSILTWAYRRIQDTLAHDYGINVNDKRILRICQKKKIQSYVKHRYNCCTRPASDPAYVAENILNREFRSDRPNEKWVTDVSEFKYGTGEDDKKGKLYLSVILDLCGNRPVAYEYGDHNDNRIVF